MKKLLFIAIIFIICFSCPFIGYWKGYNDANSGKKSIFVTVSKVVKYESRYATITGFNTSAFSSGDVVYFDRNGVIKKLKACDLIDKYQLMGVVTWAHPDSGNVCIFMNEKQNN